MPNEAPVRFLDKFDPETVPFQSVYAMSSIVDESLRNVTGALQVQEMWPNTLMVVAVDNVRDDRYGLWIEEFLSRVSRTYLVRCVQGGSLTQTRASNYPLRGGD